MEPVFENRYTTNHTMLSEFMRKYLVGPRIPTVLVTAVAYGWFGFYLYKSGHWAQMRLLMILMGVVFVAMFFAPHVMTIGSIRNVKKENGGTVPETILTFGDAIRLREGNVDLTVEYEKIYRIVHLKHSYVLLTTRRSGVLLDPEGFTKGTFADFQVFLAQKRPDLTIPQ